MRNGGFWHATRKEWLTVQALIRETLIHFQGESLMREPWDSVCLHRSTEFVTTNTMKTHTNQKKNRLTTAVSAGTLAATFIALGSLTGGANAAVTVITSGTGAAGNISITLPPINFTVTSDFAGGTLIIVFDDAQPNAGNDRGFFNFNGPNLGGGAISFYADSGFTKDGVFTENDPYVLTFNAAPFSSGDTVSFSGGTISMTSAQAGLDVFASGSYEVFLVDGNSDTRISPNGVAVPEPTSAILLGFGALGIVARRRRIK